MGLLRGLNSLYEGFFGGLQGLLEGWLLGLAARLTFASVLLMWFLSSALEKVGTGFPDMLIPNATAYNQIIPQQMQQVGLDPTQIEFFPYGLMVYAGTYLEFALPVLILVGLWTRAASLGMLCFLAVMTYVESATTGATISAAAFFDGNPGAAIEDQRLLWAFPLVYLLLRGPGAISLDAIFGLMVREEEI